MGTIAKLNNLSSKLMNDNRGLGLVELIIVLSLFSIILAMAYTFYSFGINTFNIGEKQADVQQNARLAADFITKELRVAEKVVILDSYEDIEEVDIDEALEEYRLHYIYLKEGSIFYEQMGGPEGSDILKSISEEVEFDLEIDISESRENLLKINLTAIDKNTGRDYQLETEVLVLNLEVIESMADGSGTAVFYQIPAPPAPYIGSIILKPQVHDYEENATQEVEVTVYTHNVPKGSTVEAEFRRLLDEEDSTDVPEVDIVSKAIENNYAQLTFDVPKDLYFGDYFVRVSVENEEEDVILSQRRYYYIYPHIDDINIQKKSGQPHFGEVTIQTHGVPEGTVADIILVEETEDGESEVDWGYHQGDPVVKNDGSIVFEVKLEDEKYYGRDLKLVVSIGKLTVDSEEFQLEEDEEVEEEDEKPVLEALDVSDGELDPEFYSYTEVYEVEVDSDVSEIGITAFLADPGNSLSINGDDEANSGEEKIVQLGEEGTKTDIEIVVTDDEEELSRIYTVTVYRADEAN